jgi:hypothetical protein
MRKSRIDQKNKLMKGFSFIARPINYLQKLPFEISEDLVIAKPTPYQINCIKSSLQPYKFSNIFEKIISVKESKISGMKRYVFKYHSLNDKDWMYSIVKFNSDVFPDLENPYEPFLDLQLASVLSLQELPITLHFTRRGNTTWGDPGAVNFYFEKFKNDLTEADNIYSHFDLEQTKRFFQLINIAREKYPDIYHSLYLHYSLPKLFGYNEMV